MSELFVDLDFCQVVDKLNETDASYFVEEDGTGFVANVEDGYLPNVYDSEDEAHREILAYILNRRSMYFDDMEDEDEE